MIKILKGSRFAVISHRIQQLIPFLRWGFRIFSYSRTITRSKITKWKAYSNNQTIAYKKKRGCWFTHFTMTTQSLSYTKSGRVWCRLSFERRNYGGGVADRRAKQGIRTSFRALSLFSLSACRCFYLSKKMICANRLGVARGAKPKFSAIDLI